MRLRAIVQQVSSHLLGKFSRFLLGVFVRFLTVRLLSTDNDDDKDVKVVALSKKIEDMKNNEKKRRKSKYITEHEKVCDDVKPLLPSIKELNLKSLWWLSQYVTHNKKELTEDPDVLSSLKRYKNWI
jgi:hypothetical protein